MKKEHSPGPDIKGNQRRLTVINVQARKDAAYAHLNRLDVLVALDTLIDDLEAEGLAMTNDRNAFERGEQKKREEMAAESNKLKTTITAMLAELHPGENPGKEHYMDPGPEWRFWKARQGLYRLIEIIAAGPPAP